MSTVIVVLVLYFLALAILSSLQPAEVSWRVAVLLRAFFPSWKFFEDYADIPKLFFRVRESDPWKMLEEPRARTRLGLLINPGGNQALALGSLVQQLLFDLQKTKDVPEFEKTVSFDLVRELVRRRVGPGVSSYQFKVANVINGHHDDILISPRYRA